MVHRSLTLLFLLLVLLIFSPIGSAVAQEESTSGRLADGRAYRIDAQGYRLVDQVAELEVTAEELRRQVYALENELEQKQRVIDRMESGLPPAGKIEETTLIERTARTTQRSSLPAAKLENLDPPKCNELVSSLYLRVNELESRLRDTPRRESPTPSAIPAAVGSCDYDSPANPLWEQVQRLQQALMEGPSKEQIAKVQEERSAISHEVAELKQQLDQYGDRNSKLESEVSLLKQELAKAASEQQELETALADSRDEQQSLHARAAMTAGADTAAARASRQPAPRRSSDRVEFQEELARIDELIGQRKSLLDGLQRASGSRPASSPLRTRQGTSLDGLRAQMLRPLTPDQRQSIRRGLAEIAAVLRADIATLRAH